MKMRYWLMLLPLAAAPTAPRAEDPQSPPPLVCRLDVLSPKEDKRHAELLRKVVSMMALPRELENGYAFSLDPAPQSFIEVAEWITLERRCCPFLDFTLEWRQETDTPELRLTGGPGVKEFIAAELSPPGKVNGVR